MHFRKTRATGHNPQDDAPAPAPAGIQRLELLWWRFSAAEVQRLSLLQLVQRERPSALDLPLEEGRLRFARWLVATGRLSEQTECRREGGHLAGQLWAPEAVGPAAGEAAGPAAGEGAGPAEGAAAGEGAGEAEGEGAGPGAGEAAVEVLAWAGAGPAARARLPAEEPSGEPPSQESAQGNRPPAEGRRQLRRGMAKVAALGRVLGRLDDLSDAGGPWGPYGTWGTWGTWGPYGPYGPYGPWGPYGPRGPYGSARSVADDPWRWTRLRHDG